MKSVCGFCGFSESKSAFVCTYVRACTLVLLPAQAWVCMNSMTASVCPHNHEYMWWDCNVVSEPHGSHAQPRGVGHEGEAVSHRSWDQDVGHRLLRHSEAVSGGNPQVWLITNVFPSWSFFEILFSLCFFFAPLVYLELFKIPLLDHHLNHWSVLPFVINL